MTSALVVSRSDPDAASLSAELEAAGIHVLGAVPWNRLVQEASRTAPDLVVADEAHLDDAVFASIERLQADAPRPVVVFTGDPDVGLMERAVACGVSAYEVGRTTLRLRAVLHMARIRFQREQALRTQLDALSHRFEERKLLDRAKGILMRAQQLPEDEAFRLLRAASMQSNRRVGQVSQRVIDIARCADAVNRAGQLRMLSQRLVLLYALGHDPDLADACRRALLHARTRVDLNLSTLRRTLSEGTYGDLVAAVTVPWQAFDRLLAAESPLGLERLAQADELAERMLVSADRLTKNLEVTGAAPNLHVINLSGRQRMLSQRVAKQAVLGMLRPAAEGRSAGEPSVQDAAAFEAALDALDVLPVTSAEIRDSLSAARQCWAVLRTAIGDAQHPAGRRAIADAADALLYRFELLTQQYERSMQLLMG